MRAILIAGIFLCSFLTTAYAAAQSDNAAQTKSDSISTKELKSIIRSFPGLRGRIQGVRAFSTRDAAQNSIALIAFSQETGWQMYIINRTAADKFQLYWTSGKLDDSFYVTGSEEFKVIRLDDTDAVTLAGCAAHLCPDEVFSIMVYVPSERTAFTVKYVWGKITYSQNLGTPQNQKYKKILSQLVIQRLKAWQLDSRRSKGAIVKCGV